MDRLTREQRSWNMSRIKGRDTKPEILVRSILHRLGYRFRLHHKGLPGRPDVVLARHRAVVFVHGCFWHRHRRCKYAYTPKSNFAFWKLKFESNVDRDGRVMHGLRKLGWKAVVVWECQTADEPTLTRHLRKALRRSVSKPK